MAIEYVDWFPGFLQCELIDKNGHIHTFLQKVPVVCGADTNYDEHSIYPVEITFTGKIISQHTENGKTWYMFSTKEPIEIASEKGQAEFEVWEEQVILTA